jgi:hypothetical protein
MLAKIALAALVGFALSWGSAGAAPRKASKDAEKTTQCTTDEGGGRIRPCDAGGSGGAGGGGGM